MWSVWSNFFQREVLKLAESPLGCWGWTCALPPPPPEVPSTPVLLLPLAAWFFGRRLAEGCETPAMSPGTLLFGETAKCTMPNFQEICKEKRESLLASRETTVYELGIYVLTFGFLLLKHTSGLHLVWAQLLVVYIGYWLFTLGRYTGRAVYTRPVTNSTAQSVSTTATLLYLQSWKEIQNRLWK